VGIGVGVTSYSKKRKRRDEERRKDCPSEKSVVKRRERKKNKTLLGKTHLDFVLSVLCACVGGFLFFFFAVVLRFNSGTEANGKKIKGGKREEKQIKNEKKREEEGEQRNKHKTQSQSYAFAVKSSVVLPYINLSPAVSRAALTITQKRKARQIKKRKKTHRLCQKKKHKKMKKEHHRRKETREGENRNSQDWGA
jgi:flagellar biosynthesis component FlhA